MPEYPAFFIELFQMFIQRILDLSELLQRKSHFLLGPRQTGKSMLIRKTLGNAKVYNLLEHETFASLSRQPSLLRQELTKHQGPVVIDEIQKLPNLLDEVQILIEERGLHFLLTGSSARKLRRGGVNLLGGRARSKRLHPLTFKELGTDFDLMKALNRGLLPSIYLSDEPEADLKAYCGEYLKEEIAAEGLTRNIPAFSRFLEVAALSNGQVINYQNISSDAEVARSTVQDYYSILRDTLIAEELEPWQKTRKRKAIAKSKYYFFDCGVVNSLQSTGLITSKSKAFGDAFETFIFHELASYRDYLSNGSLKFWRSVSHEEVDFILDDKVAIEVKGKERVGAHDLSGIKKLKEENLLKHYLVVSNERSARIVDDIEILPWRIFLERLWDGDFN